MLCVFLVSEQIRFYHLLEACSFVIFLVRLKLASVSASAQFPLRGEKFCVEPNHRIQLVFSSSINVALIVMG